MPESERFFTILPGEILLLSYTGDITATLPDSIYTELEEKINLTDELKSRKKRFYYIAVECLQNILRHKEDTANGNMLRPAVFMAFSSPGNYYRIVTGNEVPNSKAQVLKQQLDELSAMSTSELHDHYLLKLEHTQISEKGGAGLGLIEIARKSENNFKYTFSEQGSSTYFSLEVIVK